MSDWQPIETAPKDGKPILVCERFGWMCAAQWDTDQWVPWMPFPRGAIRCEPTHWMPLPDPQAEPATGAPETSPTETTNEDLTRRDSRGGSIDNPPHRALGDPSTDSAEKESNR